MARPSMYPQAWRAVVLAARAAPQVLVVLVVLVVREVRVVPVAAAARVAMPIPLPLLAKTAAWGWPVAPDFQVGRAL